MRVILVLFAALALAACAAPPAPRAGDADIAGLTQAFVALSPSVDPSEAETAARIAFAYPLQLRAQYGVTDPPLVHNAKVNAGLRPRGLCWHWADDLQARFEQEQFETLDLHRAIANADSRLLIDHSTVIVSAKGGAWDEGIVTDPWRFGGRLFWDQTLEDTRYDWVPRQQVFADKRRRAGL